MLFGRGLVYHPWGPWEVIMLIGMIAFWVAVVVLVVWLVRSWGPRQHAVAPPGAPPSQETALEILKRRYAAGEIDKAEFEEKRKDIG